MNRGRGNSSGRGKGRSTWSTFTANSSPPLHHLLPVQADGSPSGNVSSSCDRESHGSCQAVRHNSGAGVYQNATPVGRQRQGWSAYGRGSDSDGGSVRQLSTSSKASSASDVSHDKQVRNACGGLSVGEVEVSKPSSTVKAGMEAAGESLPFNLDRTFMESLDHQLSEESAGSNSHSDAKVAESAECVGENKSSEILIPFDICPPPRFCSGPILQPSLFSKNKEKRKEMEQYIHGQKGIVLRSGMVLLKNYLSIAEQVKILRICRTHGMGPAGFYQPAFRDGGQMHLRLMCFGEFWDPETNKYGEVRPLDGAKPPPVPQEFLQLVDRAITDSHSLIAQDPTVKNVKNILPSVRPDICLVNFYSKTGRLGLHQDKDESRESLTKGIPIVSFSIGDSADFLYGDQRDIEKADKVVLESGDALIFGGKSRHIFHGVSAILPDTAPASVLQENFRPGRLNLTFRQS